MAELGDPILSLQYILHQHSAKAGGVSLRDGSMKDKLCLSPAPPFTHLFDTAVARVVWGEYLLVQKPEASVLLMKNSQTANLSTLLASQGRLKLCFNSAAPEHQDDLQWRESLSLVPCSVSPDQTVGWELQPY